MPSAASVVIQREATGWIATFGTLFLDEPKDWRRNQRDVWHCCPRREWTARSYGGHELFAGEVRLSTIGPREGRDGWVWYASIEHCDESLAQRGGYATEAEAQAAAIAFVKSFCKTALDALPAESA